MSFQSRITFGSLILPQWNIGTRRVLFEEREREKESAEISYLLFFIYFILHRDGSERRGCNLQYDEMWNKLLWNGIWIAKLWRVLWSGRAAVAGATGPLSRRGPIRCEVPGVRLVRWANHVVRLCASPAAATNERAAIIKGRSDGPMGGDKCRAWTLDRILERFLCHLQFFGPGFWWRSSFCALAIKNATQPLSAELLKDWGKDWGKEKRDRKNRGCGRGFSADALKVDQWGKGYHKRQVERRRGWRQKADQKYEKKTKTKTK